MDPFFVAVFTFVLLLVLLVGGFVLMYPLSRRLAEWVDLQLELRRSGQSTAELTQLRETVRQLQTEVERIAERQAFTEALLTSGEPPRLGARDRSPSD